MTSLAVSRPTPARGDLRTDALAAATRAEERRLACTVVPTIGVIALLLGVPCAWLVSLSFLGPDGLPTLSHYAHLVTDEGYARSVWLTLWMAGTTTTVCLVAGYVLAYAMTLMPRAWATFTLALVALPFWTSVLVRTYAWLILLQNRGIVNSALLKAGWIEEPIRIMHGPGGALVGMVHVMLPFMVFPLFAALQRIDRDHLRAAAGMGASPVVAFWRVFFPQSLAGVAVGSVLVFVLSLGFYITPALLGGGRSIVVSIAIEHDISRNMNWGPGSAASVLFVLGVLGIFALVARFMPIERLFQR